MLCLLLRTILISSCLIASKSSFSNALEIGETTDILFLYECLDQHNYYRAKYGVPNLEYDRTLINEARSIALNLTSSDNIISDNREDVGVNIAWTSVDSNSTCRQIVDHWYQEAKYFNYGKTSHFSQLVWKGTTKIGCGQAIGQASQLSSISVCTVCVYFPRGNNNSEVKINILNPQKRQSLNSNTIHSNK